MTQFALTHFGVLLAGAIFFASDAGAACCRLIKVDAETPPATVRACTPDSAAGCDTVLFLGTLALGESQQVCPASDTLVYAEYDDVEQAFGAYVEAVCEGDVEL